VAVTQHVMNETYIIKIVDILFYEYYRYVSTTRFDEKHHHQMVLMQMYIGLY
jgi:hypothetical protein